MTPEEFERKFGYPYDQIDEEEVPEEMDEFLATYEDDETVPGSCACPCGENRMDYLVWDDLGEQVTCAKCNTVYTP